MGIEYTTKFFTADFSVRNTGILILLINRLKYDESNYILYVKQCVCFTNKMLLRICIQFNVSIFIDLVQVN